MAEKFVGGPRRGKTLTSRLSRCSATAKLEVFRMLGQGRGTPQIAETLGLSLKTVQAYCARIKEKLSLSNATELLREALRFEESTNQVG